MMDLERSSCKKFVLGMGLLALCWGLSACSTPPKVSQKAAEPGSKEAVSSRKSVPGKTVSLKIPKKSVPDKYVGMEVPPLPKGHESVLGYLVEPGNEETYSIEVIRDGSRKLVWMSRLLFHDSNGRAHWKIIAVVPPREVPEGFFFSGGNCRLRGHADPEVVAIFKMEDKKTFTQIHEAWKADLEKETFHEISPREIECINDSWNRL